MYVKLVSKVSKNETDTLTPKSFVEKMKLKFPAINCRFKTNLALLCTHPRANVCWAGFSVTLAYKNIQVTIKMIDCIQL